METLDTYTFGFLICKKKSIIEKTVESSPKEVSMKRLIFMLISASFFMLLPLSISADGQRRKVASKPKPKSVKPVRKTSVSRRVVPKPPARVVSRQLTIVPHCTPGVSQMNYQILGHSLGRQNIKYESGEFSVQLPDFSWSQDEKLFDTRQLSLMIALRDHLKPEKMEYNSLAGGSSNITGFIVVVRENLQSSEIFRGYEIIRAQVPAGILPVYQNFSCLGLKLESESVLPLPGLQILQ